MPHADPRSERRNIRQRTIDVRHLTSLQAHILAEESRHPEASGDFTWIMSALSLAGKIIADKVRRARLEEVLGEEGESNVHGEEQQKLDVLANDVLIRSLGDRANIALVASEEDEQPTIIRRGREGGKYCVLFDPLDGSSNLDVGVGVGTIFSILRNDPDDDDPIHTVCQRGDEQLAAGYILYGSSTVFVVTTGNGVDMFELDPTIGSFMLVKPSIRIPARSKTYSINEAYSDQFPPGYRAYLQHAHANGYSSRYIGSMVADVHRTLLNGGVFMYPPTTKHPDGKLRLLYEANPMSWLIEQAGGRAYSGLERTLSIEPRQLHQRTSVLLGSPEEVDLVRSFFRTPEDAGFWKDADA
ncbi:MAG TPA: class 1 fructose-bisphosphatase [Phycisphaerales bacterium]|nr:class 1 fructose-bisphosphatase [Phycisphaerales bacterium]HMP38465.1 class 1 fructose-bisphosphatase [Phycisphaerales bacterium]